MDAGMIGESLGGASARTGRRFIDKDCPIPIYIVRGKKFVKRSEFERWLESRRVEPKPGADPMTELIREISDAAWERVQRRNAGAA